ncbi:hypothetical protein [Kutzneria sp. NPDC052558]|uniref:hypothetical protein n=1 Tax=Kutzneria sp. NPDC052558 TaxID=3364121 RepID=UPI0037CC550C
MRTRVVVLAAAVAASAIAAAGPAQAQALASRYTAVTPQRVLDTRDGTGVSIEGDHLVLDLSRVTPSGTTAVVVNLTGADANVDSFVTVWPDGDPRPTVSNLNVSRGQTAANLTTVAVPTSRKLDVWVHGDLGVIADLSGYYAPTGGSGYSGHSPSRVLDTRTGGGPAGPDRTTVLDLSSTLPANTTAVVFNLTGTNTTAATYLTAWPDGTSRPDVSSMNLAPGQTRANMVTVAVPPSGKIDLYNHAGSVDLIADVSGYYLNGSGKWFYPTSPQRLIDTRDSAPVGPDSTVTVTTGHTGEDVVVNLTATDATAATYLTAWQPKTDSHVAGSSLNLGPGETVPNMAIVSTWSDAFGVYNHAGTVDVIVDLAGYFVSNIP